MKTSALVLSLFLGANAKISADQKAVVAEIKKEIASTQNLAIKSVSLNQTKVAIVEEKVEDLINDVITDVTKQEADEKVLNKALYKKMTTEWPVTNKAVEDAYGDAFDSVKKNFNHTTNGDMQYVKINNQDTVVKAFKDAYDKDVAAGEGYVKDLKAHKAAVEAAEKKNMNYDDYIKQGKSIKVAVKDAIDSIETTAGIEDGTTSLYMKSASVDQTKLKTLEGAFGDLVSDVASDAQTYQTKKKVLDKAMWKKMSTVWPTQSKTVEDAYGDAFDSVKKNFNYTINGDMQYAKIDNQDTVVKAFKDAYDLDVATGKKQAKDLIKYDTAVKKAQKDSFDIIQYKKDWADIEDAADDLKASVKTTADIEDGTTSLVMKTSAGTTQEKKVNTAIQAIADAVQQIEDDMSAYSDDKEEIDEDMYNTIMNEWVPNSKKVNGLYEDAFEGLQGNTTMTNNGTWGTLKVINQDSVVNAFKEAYTADVAEGKAIDADIKNYTKSIKDAQDKNFNKTVWKTKITKAELAIKDAVKAIENGAEVDDGTTSLYTTSTIEVSEANQEKIAAKIDDLAEKFETMDDEKDVISQIKKEIAIIDSKNGLTKWAKKNNIEKDMQDIVDSIDKNVKVTNAAQEIPTWTENITLEDSVLYSTLFVFAFAAVLASISHNIVATPAKKETIEFDIESSEMIKIAPKQKENKKVIKKTLANIMKKNNAKTTLIQ